MAIDTAKKRASMMNFGEDSIRLPIPSGSFDQGDRQTFLGLYSGILAIGSIVGGRGMMQSLLIIRGDD